MKIAPIAIALLFGVVAGSITAQEKAVDPAFPDPNSEPKAPVEEKVEEAPPKATQEDFEAFEKLLTNSVLRGHFTMKNAPAGAAPKEEEYVIKKVTMKSEDGRSWLFSTAFNYGGRDWTLPLPIKVEWAGKTPVITLDDFTIPLMGTFSARVLFDDGQYAGTWSHGKAGGHLYGVVESGVEAEAEAEAKGAPSE